MPFGFVAFGVANEETFDVAVQLVLVLVDCDGFGAFVLLGLVLGQDLGSLDL